MNMLIKRPQKPSRCPDLISLLLALLFACVAASPSVAGLTEECTDCHGTFGQVHGEVDHTATPASDSVTLFSDNSHDEAGWVPPKPYFAVAVDCVTCHAGDLISIHGQNCTTCHPSPYNTLETWNGGCQQGGCHSNYHADSIPAHQPFEDSRDYEGNDCYVCHDHYNGYVTQAECLNCHATYGTGDTTPPVTSTDAKSSYEGPAKIVFSIKDNGKVGVGMTYYRLDSGEEMTGSHVIVTAPGQHSLEFWSVDQAGNIEYPPKRVSFTTVSDITPPTTTSDARESYDQGATITLTAVDNSDLGVKNTFYKVDEGPTQTGTSVLIPPVDGTIEYTLTFWSEDWSGNVESQKSVTFSVTSGTGTLRLVWLNSDVSGSPCSSTPNATASWTVRVGSSSGLIVTSGSGSCPNWSGVNDVSVRVNPEPYFVSIKWEDDYEGDVSYFSNIYITEPGQLVRLSY